MWSRTGLTLVISTLSALFISTASMAVTIYVDASATGANNGTSWTDAYTDLQDALADASSGDEIWVAAGAYKPAPPGGDRAISFVLVDGTALYGGFPVGGGTIEQRDLHSRHFIGPGIVDHVALDSHASRAKIVRGFAGVIQW